MILLKACNLVQCQHNHSLESLFKNSCDTVNYKSSVSIYEVSTKYRVQDFYINTDTCSWKMMHSAKMFINKTLE